MSGAVRREDESSRPAEASALAQRMLDNIETVVLGKRDEIALVLAALACERARPARGRPGHGEDRPRPLDRPDDRGRDRRPASSARRTCSRRRHRALDLQPEDARLRVPARPGLRQHRARRRDQPGDAEDAVGAARGDGRASGHGRRRHAAAARAVPRDRHGEPDRAGRHLPAPRGAARPVHAADRARLPAASRGGSDRPASSGTGIRSRRSGQSSPRTTCARSSDAVEDVYVDDLLLDWIVDLVRATREVEGVATGASVRGSLALERRRAAWALLHGRELRRP